MPSSIKNKVYFFVFDGFADWECALALCVLKEQPHLEVVTVGFSKDIVQSMGGVKVVPDISLDRVNPNEALIFIVPGGTLWENFEDIKFFAFLQSLDKAEVVLAAICGATLAFGRAGLFKEKKHTSNGPEFLKELAPEYQDELLYQNQPAVTDRNIITASGTGFVEFAYEIMKALSIYDEPARRAWRSLFLKDV